MKATTLIAAFATLALSTSGIVPAPIFTSEAYGQPRATSGKGQRSKRGTRNKSKASTSAKVSRSKKAANSGKTSSRKRSGKSSKTAVSLSAAPVKSTKSKLSRTKSGSGKRASMTAVANVPMTGKATSTPNATPGQRASLQVNTSTRSPRSKRVTKRSNGRRSANNRKKQSRATSGKKATAAVQTAPQGSGRKVTFNLTPQVVKFDNTQPPSAIRGGSDNRSSISTVLTRRPMQLRQQGVFSRVAGRVARAFTWSKSETNAR